MDEKRIARWGGKTNHAFLPGREVPLGKIPIILHNVAISSAGHAEFGYLFTQVPCEPIQDIWAELKIVQTTD